MENLDYVLQRMEERTPDNFPLANHGRTRSSTFSTRTLLDSYKDKPKERCSCCSYKVISVVLILALLAWGIAVPVYFLIGPGSELRTVQEGPKVAAQTQRATFDHSFLNGTVLNAINGTIRIVNQRFTPSLANHFSAEYQALKLKLETLLSVVFNKKSDFNKAAVIGFRPGSVVVQFVLIFNKNQLLVRHLVQTTLTRYLGSHWSMLGTFQVDIGSIDIRNVRNQCAVDNGGCSHLCFWSVLSAGYECRCPQQYRLLNDGKSCFPEELPKATTTSNPCADDQFLCRSRNCIPNRWLCDGVSDCLLGEDEASHMCQSPIRRKPVVQNGTSPRRTTDQQLSRDRPVYNPSDFQPPPARRPTAPAPRYEKLTDTKPGAEGSDREVVAPVVVARPTPVPVFLLQRRPAQVIEDINPPSLVKEERKDEEASRRGFSFFG